MVELSQEIDKLLCKEDKAIAAISDYMRRNFNANRDWKDEKKKEAALRKQPKPSKSAEIFWEKCIEKFETYAVKHTFEFIREIPLCYTNNSSPNKKTYSEDDDIDECAVEWKDDIEELIDIYQALEKRYLKYHKTEREECRDAFEKISETLKQNRDKKIEKSMSKTNPFKRIQLNFLAETLNLKNKDICAMLPYLMTAFTINYWENHLLYEGCKFTEKAFVGKADSREAASILRQIDKYSKYFSLSANRNKIVSISDDRPSPFIPYIGKSFTWGAELLDDVFTEWCAIISECAKDYRLYRLKDTLNLDESRKLFDYYLELQKCKAEQVK